MGDWAALCSAGRYKVARMGALATIGSGGYKIFLFLHILAVVVALGPTFGYGIFFSVLPRYPRSAPALDRRACARSTGSWSTQG